MSDYFDAFKIKCSPVAKEKCTVVSGNTRITVLTPSLVRVENTSNGIFCNKPTQAVWFRDFDEPEFEKTQQGNTVVIKTEKAEFCYNTEAEKMEYIKLADSRVVKDYKSGNLKGTRRTLDQTFGPVSLGDGIISKNGVAILDDSKTLVIDENAQIVPRKSKGKDIYYFAYGYEYREAVRDFFNLTGHAPLVPRFALGNWWSRYKAYTQQEYIDLMQRFIDEEIPITVATVDMDWHWVDIVGKFGKQAKINDSHTLVQKYYDAISRGGWTGYSWNTDLFPDPKGFLDWLHSKNFKVTLNLHPATGVRWFEDKYGEFSRFMGDDPKQGKHYFFDITDKKFTEAYFSILHKPMQDDGVNFWWIDWQQGKKTNTPGLDPLWALNHYHSMDIARESDRRPLILSRFAEAGSHRYPLGFSGDTAQNWSSLKFQPYFTATASNIGYTWWSHDIGGHHMGKKDDELYTRWVQYGIFSPVNRLHSSSNEFMGKEPWKYNKFTEKAAVDALRLRHRMIPYIYTMNYRTHHDGVALCEPMYYRYPKEKDAYGCPNEYFFGSELIAAPITEPKNKKTNLAGVEVWLPEGRYTDIFTGRIYKGKGKIKMFRDCSSIPVLAKEGAIIPLSVNDRTNDSKNPDSLELLIYRGNNKFSMYEDDGETMNFEKGEYAFTDYEVKESDTGVEFTISPAAGDAGVLPEARSYKLSFKDIVCADASVYINGEPAQAEILKGKTLCLCVKGIKPADSVRVELKNVRVADNGDKKQNLIELISKFQGNNNKKAINFDMFVKRLGALPPSLPACFTQPIKEIEKMHSFEIKN